MNTVILGTHQSIAGGLQNAIYQAAKLKCQCVQFFCANQRQWNHPPLSPRQIETFRQAVDLTRLKPLVVHASYLINLAAVNKQTLQKSISALQEEYTRCDLLGVDYLVMHPGSHMGQGEEKGIKKIAHSINRILDRVPSSVKILLETTSGHGSSLGHSFEQLADIVDRIEDNERIGICLDTCHIFAAGYDIRTKETYTQTMNRFKDVIGLNKLHVIHANDSLTGLGSHVDRHEHIGKGKLGKNAFRNFLTDKRLKHIPFILETPKGISPSGRNLDLLNLAALRRLVR